jgi:hypothetical protein
LFSLVGCLFDAVRDPACLFDGEREGDVGFRVVLFPVDVDADLAGAVADLEGWGAEVDGGLVGLLV